MVGSLLRSLFFIGVLVALTSASRLRDALASQGRAKPDCAAITGKSAQENVDHLISLTKSGSQFPKKFIEWSQCLVPVDKQGQTFSWQWKLDQGANCDKYAEVISRYAEKFVTNVWHKLHDPFEIAREELTKAAGSNGRFLGDDLSYVLGVWDLCNGRKPSSEMGVSDKPEPGTSVTIKIKANKGIPKDEGWPIPDELISAHAFCFHGEVTSMGDPFIGDTDVPDRHRKTTVVSLRKYKKYQGYTCQMLDTGARRYFGGKLCLASVWFKKLSRSLPWHLIVDEASVSDCPYEFVVASDNSESAPSFEVRMKPGRGPSSPSADSKPAVSRRPKL